VRIGLLERSRLDEATTLLRAALPHDRVAVVAAEKLFGSDGARQGVVHGAFSDAPGDDGRLVGLVAAAGRWIKVLAVAESHRRRGIGTQLLAAVPGTRRRVGDHPGNYLMPGVDVRYGEALAFFAARGFVRVGEVENIRAPLDAPLPCPEVAGYRIERPDATTRAPLLAWIGRAFAPVWAHEVALALDGPRRAVHAAWHGDTPVAFAAADGNNQGLGWFGPAGTDPAHRGKRLGEALLQRCLEDVRGLPEAGVIAWIGPKAFYAKTVGAVDDRRFVQLQEPNA
jgi:GNAT superfamily N-acetyltransferase